MGLWIYDQLTALWLPLAENCHAELTLSDKKSINRYIKDRAEKAPHASGYELAEHQSHKEWDAFSVDP
jgi:hypothetical protein